MSTTGSSYETYDDTHKNYDLTRLAVGNAQLIEMLGDVELTTLRILDAGCGTGVHLTSFDAMGIHDLTGLDFSVTGLAQTAAKFAHKQDDSRPTLICADIRDMPFAEGSFDLILFSFVLHHLPHTSHDELAEATKSLLSKTRRFLAPGGKLAIISCSPQQLSPDEGCMWYYSYFPEAANNLASRFLPLHTMRDLLEQTEFWDIKIAPVKATYWTEASLDPEGPFQNEWRSGDSLFALCAAHPERFESELTQLRHDIESGTITQHIETVRNRANTVKQATIVLATRP